jgi:predicted pyridoxine 5'-phosphate oxidase superfamily flavin-nucleotide-binding protein
MERYLNQVLESPSRVLATFGPAGINVVPVSVVSKEGDALILHDFFMDKTVINIKASGDVAVAAWDGLVGVQLKGQACYESSGDSYNKAVTVMRERFPGRTLRGIIRIVPQSVFSVSPSTEAGRLLV